MSSKIGRKVFRVAALKDMTTEEIRLILRSSHLSRGNESSQKRAFKAAALSNMPAHALIATNPDVITP